MFIIKQPLYYFEEVGGKLKKLLFVFMTLLILSAFPEKTWASAGSEKDPGYDQLLKQAAYEKDEPDNDDVLLFAGNKRKILAVGVDVWNGNGKIDWARAKKAGVQFAIIRVGFRYLTRSAIEEDMRAQENMKGAASAGIPFGVYFFSTAINKNEVIAEAKLTLKVIKGHKLSYPVFFDPEGYDLPGTRNHGLSNEKRTDLALAYMEFIRKNGYEAALYSSKSHFTDNRYWLTDKIDSNYDIWVAQYPGGLHGFADGKKAQTTYEGIYRIWQYSSEGRIDGIPNYVDLNIEYEEPSKEPVLTDYNYPSSMEPGTSFSIQGKITSASKLEKVTVGIFDGDGKKIYRKIVKPAANKYDISTISRSLKFRKLKSGIYQYRIYAVNDAGRTLLLEKTFAVLSDNAGLKDGLYVFKSSGNSKFCIAVKDNNKAAKANIQLSEYNSENNFEKFELIYKSKGYYYIKNIGSSKYLNMASKSGGEGTNIRQGTGKQLWRILPCGEKGYVLIPKTGPEQCAGIKNDEVKQNASVITAQLSMDDTNLWQLKKTKKSERSKAESPQKLDKTVTISDYSVPGTRREGSGFNIKGKIVSKTKVISLNVGVWNLSGSRVIGKKGAPYKTNCDLSVFNDYIDFKSLKPGVYNYRVVVQNSSGTHELVQKAFSLLSNNGPVKAGTYRVMLSTDKTYALGIKEESKNDNAPVVLSKSDKKDDYQKFEFEYDSYGYYYIKDKGSGKYLGVKNNSAAKNAAIVQSSKKQLWQVLPYGDGSYGLVPKSSVKMIMSVKQGNIKVGRDIVTLSPAYIPTQRFIIAK